MGPTSFHHLSQESQDFVDVSEVGLRVGVR